jgi:hypothetical protein
MRKSLDVLLLFALLLARVMMEKFAEAGLFEHFQNVTGSPVLGRWLPSGAAEAFGPWYGDPILLLLASLSLLAFLGYILFDLFKERVEAKTLFWGKYLLLISIIMTSVIAPAVKLSILRHENLPHSYSHDGGVLQTEAAIDFFLDGKNPYIEDYRDTPMADWGFEQFRTALDHYPYLPATFVISSPFKLISNALWGWYDQRFTYLIFFVLTLVLVAGLTRGRPDDMLGLTMFIGLNPIMGMDITFGQNDSFVLAWLVLSAWFLYRRNWLWSSIFFGIAAASKPTAWFLAPFWGLAMLDQPGIPLSSLVSRSMLSALLRRTAPAIITFLVFTLPFFLWSPYDFIDDVWRWAAGTAQTHYQIWGLGFANFVLAWGGLPDRFAYWPFWMPEIIIAAPLLIALIIKQLRDNTISSWFWHGAILLSGFAYFSRFLNENYLGFLLALFAMGYYVVSPQEKQSGA